MNLRNLGAHKNEIQLNDAHNTCVLISYETPVAYCQTYDGSTKWFKTEKKWSATTTKHINRWLDGTEALKVPQSSLDLLMDTLNKPISEVK